MEPYLCAMLAIIVPCVAPQTIARSKDDTKCFFCTNPRINLPYVNHTWSSKGCSDTGCYGVPYEDLTVIYSGLFNTRQQQNQLLTSSGGKIVYYEGQDSCCPRKVYYSITYHMKNWDGISKALVQIPVLGRHQFVPHVDCSKPINQHCLGDCIPRNTLMHFLVWVQHPSQFFWEFDLFEVPTYCSFRMT